ncbi:MAG: type II toxin-antitoxin system RelE/ParE family toxin [Pseudomonadota bacterium]
MQRYWIRMKAEALADLEGIEDYLSRNASAFRAEQYLGRIRVFLEGLRTFPERGSVRHDIRPGLRVIGFERRIAVAFTVEGDEVVIFRLLYGGRSLDPNDLELPPTPGP